VTGLNLPDRATTLLAGVVGSTAYGLNLPGSDVDIAAIYAWPTRDLVTLDTPVAPDTAIPETIHRVGDPDLKGTIHEDPSPDLTAHEARKFLTLILRGNPSVTELLWLPDYLHLNPWGHALIGIREHLSSGPLIRASYLGYATQQFQRLETRGDGSFSADTRKRTAKHARHLLRLCRQGFDFWSTGTLTIRVDNPDEYHRFGEDVAAGNINRARRMITFYESAYNNCPCALPDQPDTGRAADWLAALRKDYWW
jgi:hypothetical protein